MFGENQPTDSPNLVILAAMDGNRAIGRGLDIPWHLPDDLQRFKQMTVGKPNIMGWNTALSLGRALPKRRNMVVSRTREAPWPGMETYRSFEAAVAAAAVGLGREDEIMIIGGILIYAHAMEAATHMRLVHVHGCFHGCDVFFPQWDRRQWRIGGWEHHPVDARHAHAFDYIDLERVHI